MFLESLLFSINVTLPTILMMLLGVWLRRRKMVNDEFANMASKLVFNFTLPPMLFLNIARGEADYSHQIGLVTVGIIGTVLTWIFAEIWAAKRIENRRYRGIFVQATFRSNMAILGLALVFNAYGEAAVTPMSVYAAVMVILFNTLGVITLSRSLSDTPPNLFNLLWAIAKNPLIIAVVAGMLVSHFELYPKIPTAALKTADYLAHVTLPLALICTGASLNFKQLANFHNNTDNADQEAANIVWQASLVRLLIAPVAMFILGKWVFELSPMALGIIFLSNAAPVASATYPMVRNYGGDAVIAANIIGVTTVGSIFVSSFGLLFLRQLGWI